MTQPVGLGPPLTIAPNQTMILCTYRSRDGQRAPCYSSFAIKNEFDGADRIDSLPQCALNCSLIRQHPRFARERMPEPARKTSETLSAGERMDALDWKTAEESLSNRGYAVADPILSPAECASLTALYKDESRFRSQIIMERYRFGIGDYKYFGHPLPELVSNLRTNSYPHLAGIANRWAEALGMTGLQYPEDHAAFLRVCRKAGQTKPTPWLLHYEAGGYNCLHQDIYGDVVFPLQLTAFLSRRGADYAGGEFLLVEQRPRAQSRGDAIATEQGELVIFATRHRPLQGARGWYRAALRHGVSTIHRGTRYTLGIIFHDAK